MPPPKNRSPGLLGMDPPNQSESGRIPGPGWTLLRMGTYPSIASRKENDHEVYGNGIHSSDTFPGDMLLGDMPDWTPLGDHSLDTLINRSIQFLVKPRPKNPPMNPKEDLGGHQVPDRGLPGTVYC